ncbi:Hypothetical predicted protein [Pelobates cultripes]|uniref:Uncharacterized protein n=1 Tax=Pelobates cultripes TaxID=61616 RepID=A0AAD1SGT7_PELCU|nr:Hypothetical predicted protein [Pelobates cultripes]
MLLPFLNSSFIKCQLITEPLEGPSSRDQNGPSGTNGIIRDKVSKSIERYVRPYLAQEKVTQND